jgi:calnexin
LVPDPDAKKPDDWDESQPRQIRDENAVMPDGWLEDERQEIPDPESEKPSDWDEEMDGEWEAGLVIIS